MVHTCAHAYSTIHNLLTYNTYSTQMLSLLQYIPVVHCTRFVLVPIFCYSSLDPVLSPAGHSIPKFQHPSHMLLKANGFRQQQYYKYRYNCLKGTVKPIYVCANNCMYYTYVCTMCMYCMYGIYCMYVFKCVF